MTTLARITFGTATAILLAAGTTACSHGYVDVRGYNSRPYGYNADGYAEVDIIGSDGFRHHGYYDRDRAWHGGWYDNNRGFHEDRRDWHR